MKRTEIKVLVELSKGTKTLAELESAIGKSKSWLSEIIKGLEERGFLRKEKGGRKIRLSNNYETRVLLSLLNEFSLQSLFCGKKEFILRSLPKSVAGLEKQFSKSMIYQSIKDFEELGVVREREGKFFVVSPKLKDFLKVTAREEIGRGGEEGIETAFLRFADYGILYYPKQRHFYTGADELSINHILAHALALAEDKKQFSICCIFYLIYLVVLT
jgi:DNA-binding Lrp family transcriptional regulator